MANIEIISETTTQTHIYTSLLLGTKAVYTVDIEAKWDGTYVNVSTKNSLYTSYNGSGKHFHGQDAFEQAEAAYDVSEVKVAIKYVKSLL